MVVDGECAQERSGAGIELTRVGVALNGRGGIGSGLSVCLFGKRALEVCRHRRCWRVNWGRSGATDGCAFVFVVFFFLLLGRGWRLCCWLAINSL